MKSAGITSGPVFRRVRRLPSRNASAPAKYIVGNGITGQSISNIVATWADAASLPTGRWSGHSLRAGFAVQGIIDGTPETELRAQTGHRSVQIWDGYAQRAAAMTVRRNTNFGARK
jgi:hypothetical protein